MAPFEATNLAALDRDVARAHAAWTAWVAHVVRVPAVHADEEPLEPWRHATTKSTFDALGVLQPSRVDEPMRDALRRWVSSLLQLRVTGALLAERATVVAERAVRVPLPIPVEASWNDVWPGLVLAESSTERRAWLDAGADRAPAVASIERRISERRAEAASRLGLPDGGLSFPIARAPLVALAEAVLARTDDLAKAVFLEARSKLGLARERPHADDALAIAVARDAPEGWPARLTWRWLDVTFAPFLSGLRVRPEPLPIAAGGASFLRATSLFGRALRLASANPSLPFSLARDPQSVPLHRFAAVFGALPASPAFQRRVLGNGARVASHQARVLARSLLFAARFEAMRFLVGRDLGARGRFEELGDRVLGAPVDGRFFRAWPPAHDDDEARLVGLVTAVGLSRQLVERFDEDWFANPRAVLHLRAIGSAPAYEDPLAVDPSDALALGSAFEEALG